MRCADFNLLTRHLRITVSVAELLHYIHKKKETREVELLEVSGSIAKGTSDALTRLTFILCRPK